MKPVKKNSLSERAKSFKPAFEGIKELWRKEPNFRIHIVLLGFAIAMGLFFKITTSEWLAVISISSLVLVAEALNTALENSCNLIDLNKNEQIRIIKDVAAAGVLIAAIAAFSIGLIIFLPKVLQLI